MDEKFYKWARATGTGMGLSDYMVRKLEEAWIESARRADRRAREECCEIVRSRKVAIECATEFDKAYNRAVEYLAQAILSTIPEQQK